MKCSDYADLIALAAAGEATDTEKQQVETHIQACDACRTDYFRIADVVGDLSAPGLDTLSPGERLELENTILRKALDARLRSDTRRRMQAPVRVVFRIAATLAMFWLGYLTHPLLSGQASPQSDPVVPVSIGGTRADLRQALNSGLRFSGTGLRAIAHGHKALNRALVDGREAARRVAPR